MMADTLIRVLIKPAKQFTDEEYNELIAEIARGFTKIIEENNCTLADFMHFDKVNRARPSEKTTEG